MISIDSSVFIHLVNFLILIWALNTILYRPIRQILIKRKDKLIGLDHDIKTCVGDAEDKTFAFDAGIRQARSHGVKEKETILKAAAEEERRIIDEIGRKNQESAAEFQIKISENVEKVKATLLSETDVFAKIIVRKILGRVVS
jgi:F-type H+-transporting ATPase subunit b